VVIATALCLGASHAEAMVELGPPRADVAVIRPAADDSILVEASARLCLELGAAGLNSVLVDAADDDVPATIAFLREGDVASIDLVGTRPDGSALHRRVRVPPEEGGGDPAVLAVRAAELLRDIRLDMHRAARPPAQPVPSPPAATTVAAAPWHPWIITAGAGVFMAGLTSGAVGPALGFARAVSPHLSIAATLAGPFFSDLQPTDQGSAHTREEFGFLSLRAEVDRNAFGPYALLSAGAYHLSAAYDARRPSGSPPPSQFQIQTDQVFWAPALAVGFGAGGRIWRRLGVTFELSAVFTHPRVHVTASDRVLGQMGEPAFLQQTCFWIAFP
jgi:hypothetical protein